MATYKTHISESTRAELINELNARSYVATHAKDVVNAINAWDGKMAGKRFVDYIARTCPGFVAWDSHCTGRYYITYDGRADGLPTVPVHARFDGWHGIELGNVCTRDVNGRARVDASTLIIYKGVAEADEAEKIEAFLSNASAHMDALNRAAAGYRALYDALPAAMRDNRRTWIYEQAHYLPIPF